MAVAPAPPPDGPRRPRAWRPVAAAGMIAGALYLLAQAAAPAEVTVRWHTGSESDVVGFHVWRLDVDAPAGADRRVTDALVPATGSALAGAEYTFVDRAVRRGATYRYAIAEVDARGTATRHPDTITVGAGWPTAWLVAEAVAMLVLGAWLGFAGRHGGGARGAAPPG